MNALAQIPEPAPVRAGLTPRQRDCFEAIMAHIALHRCSPSYRELRIAMGLKTSGRINELLSALQERGWIAFQPRKQRSIAVLPGTAPAYTLPPNIEAALRNHCQLTGDNPADVVADAVVLFFDEAEGSVAA